MARHLICSMGLLKHSKTPHLRSVLEQPLAHVTPLSVNTLGNAAAALRAMWLLQKTLRSAPTQHKC